MNNKVNMSGNWYFLTPFVVVLAAIVAAAFWEIKHPQVQDFEDNDSRW